MTEPTKKLNIISLEELKGEINLEKKDESRRGEESSPVSEKFFIEKKDNNNNDDDNVKKHHDAPEKNINNIIKTSQASYPAHTTNSFIEKKKEIKNNDSILENPSDLKQINKQNKTKNIVKKIEKTKNTEKIYINIQEASKISGISTNTIRKSLKSNELSYFFEKGKYSIELENFLKWIFQSQRKINIINTKGIGKYIETWKI